MISTSPAYLLRDLLPSSKANRVDKSREFSRGIFKFFLIFNNKFTKSLFSGFHRINCVLEYVANIGILKKSIDICNLNYFIMSIIIRKAQPKDIPAIYRLICELAIFEKEPDAVEVTEEEL